MQFSNPPARERRESIVPMINVVFLLLIFFLMTAQITPPEPFEVTPPDSAAQDAAEGQSILFVSADGAFAFAELRGDAVLTALPGLLGEGEPLLVRADRSVDAGEIARLLPKLAAAGVRQVKLVSMSR